jgi:hypothetical protein
MTRFCPLENQKAHCVRYYGDSFPVSSLCTDDLRFLNNAEALEDSAYVRIAQLARMKLMNAHTVHRELQTPFFLPLA